MTKSKLRLKTQSNAKDERAAKKAKLIHIDMKLSKRKEVVFAWADGIFWQRWIESTYNIDVKDGERVIINDQAVSLRTRWRRFDLVPKY